ncbi:MAG: DUF805 domain-containing protein [Campylobacterota bacterium]|nr:DUF805 domain-containing protein [Campylobacterota bacterium]
MELFNRYFMETIKQRYAQFDGRASRSEFWYFALFSLIISIALGILDGVLGTAYSYEVVTNTIATATVESTEMTVTQTIGYMQTLYSLLILIPSIAVSIRRLHDIGKSGWWLLIAIVPIIGLFILLFFYVKDSQSGDNEYGENPKSS